MPKIALVFILWLGVGFASATGTLRWVGGDGNWHEPGNWNPARVPAAGDDIVIDTGTPVTVNYSGDVVLNSLDVTGNLILSDGSLTVTHPSQITGTLTLDSDATLIADGPQATLSVGTAVTLDTGNVYALNGGHISFPTATNLGSGILRAQGSGSRLDLANIGSIGLGEGGELSITDAVSREVSVFNSSGPPIGGLDIFDAISREVSVFNDTSGSGGSGVNINDAVSREVSVFNDTSGSGGSSVNITDANSREISVFNSSSAADIPIRDAVSREVSVEKK